MNSVGMGSDEIYFCTPFKTLSSVALETELKNEKSMAGNSIEAGGVEILGSSSLSSSRGWGLKSKKSCVPTLSLWSP